MAKAKKRQSTLFPETEDIISLLNKESEQDLVVLAVPSHDRRNRELPAATIGEWSTSAMRLMADLYVGGTAYQAHSGVYKTDEGHYLFDKPIIIESFARHDAINDPGRLNDLVAFAKRMGKALDQDAVMVVVGPVMYYIKDYGGV